MSSTRREFLRHMTAVIAGVSAHGIPVVAAAQQNPAMPTPRAAALMKAFGLTLPIFQAGMASIATPELAIAVSAAGGLGAIGIITDAPERVRTLVSSVKAGTNRPFAVNFLLAFDPPTLGVALEAGAPGIQFAWGIPSKESVAAIRTAGAKMGIQIASAEGARRALDLGADYLICQGTEAGGHVQASTPLQETLPRVLEAAHLTPVLAAGGIADGRAIRRALVAGASGVLIGTRFVATQEAGAHSDYKNLLIRANAGDTVFTVCFQDGWPNAPHRVLRNPTFSMWEAAGCPPPGKRPGEGDVVATQAGNPILRYKTIPPGPAMTGMITHMAMYAGQGVGAIRDLPSAGELVERLWEDCVAGL
ncbi:MAG: nitronate monooxygenase [Deltaproteobacteria bacterium]|nr:nitronate monooxygenase [Deltaproteobacteria bacterium]